MRQERACFETVEIRRCSGIYVDGVYQLVSLRPYSCSSGSPGLWREQDIHFAHMTTKTERAPTFVRISYKCDCNRPP